MDKFVAGSLLTWTIDKYREDVEILPVMMLLREVARKNDKRPAKIEMHAPDEWVRNLTGEEDLRDVYLISRVPREHFQAWHAASQEATKAAEELNQSAPTDPVPAG